MMRINTLFTMIAVTLLLLFLNGSSRGAETEPPVKLTLHPAAQPIPALMYRLLPSRLDQKPGNAAVHYGKVTAEETRFFSSREMLENIDCWQETPLDELRNDQVNLPTRNAIEGSIRRGAHCRVCDWQLPIGEVPFYGMPLSEVQQTRNFARILSVRARMQIADGEFANAVETLQSGYSLGRHVAAGETIVNALVGIAICEIMSRQVLDFVQQPKAPNLYWALTMLPRPLIEMRDALDVEAMGVELSFPELRDIKTAERTPDEWRALFHRFAKEVIEQTSDNESPKPPTPDQLDERCRQMLPAAKQSLIAGGLPAEQVDAMPIHQVALLYTLSTQHELVDEVNKYYFLPYPQASAGVDAVIERAKQEQREVIPIAERLFPGLRVTRSAVVRNDRTIVLLRVIEALRIYAASHAGKLPETLSDITGVPVPDDPVTGAAFGYRREGDKAILQGPTFRDVPLNYEITMARP